MQNYKIITDFGCDLPEHITENLEIEIIPTALHIEGEPNVLSNEIDISDFYAKLRDKKMIKTSAVSIAAFEKSFGRAMAEGNDVLYIGMSSGLSGTFGAAKVAADTVLAEYPERKISFIDTHSGCGGEGLAVYLAALKKAEGASFEEVSAYMQDIGSRISTWFMVDDLFFLKRGGRLRAATAVVGSLLMIKPILGVNEEGKLVANEKARGRKGAMEALIRKIEELCENPKESIIMISHSDCMKDAVNFEMMIRTKWDVKDIIITDIGPAFGAHCGPDTIAVFFISKEKNSDTETE